MPTTKSDVPVCCDRCDSPMPAGTVEDEFDELLCENCQQNIAERAWERMCEDFHDGGNTSFADGERVRMEAARRLK